jgi:predicted O-linked N-acetylglucosamine transferase (SPINDLY family)
VLTRDCAAEPEPSLGRLRADLAGFWLNTPAAELERHYRGEAGVLHKKLAIGCLKDTSLTPDERRLVDQVVSRIQAGVEGSELVRFLLVAVLYLHAYRLPANLDLMKLPHWLRDDVFRFQLTFPNLLNQPGETDACSEHLDRVTARLHEGIHSATPVPWQQMAITFAEKANFQPLYFSQRNPKPIVERRADIVDYATRLKRHDLEYRMPPRPKGTRRIRLGIHSWSIRPHTETFATLPIFSTLDPLHFDIRLYIHQSDGNPVEQRARGLAQVVTVLPEMLKACVETIRADDLDILVFGNNITAGNSYAFSLANYRMARVQCIHFCNPVTSGKHHMDCFLLGKLITDRLHTNAHFSERVITIDGSGICFDLPDTPDEVRSVLSRSDLGIAQRGPVFISGANFFKIIPELRHTWAKILAQVPDSVLLLYPFGPAWSHAYPKLRLQEGISRVFEQYGVRSERFILMDTLKGRGDVLALNRMADVYLDAVPYNGATSLLDPLREGVPPVVLDGRELRFAQGAAILRELGVPELVTRDEDEYIRLAVRLATDAAMRETIRQTILERMSCTPAFLNPRLYAERVAAAFKALFPDAEPLPRRSIAGPGPRVDGVGRTAP